MLTDDQLLELLRGGESDRVEFVESAKDADKIREAICAFANDMPGNRQPGVVFIGADDNGNPTGLRVDDRLLLTLRDWRTNGNIHPFPSMSVQKRNLNGADVAVVEVEPSIMPPVHYRGRCCIRTGSGRDFATPEDERRLIEKRVAAALPFDRRPALPRAGLEDLSVASFEEYLPLAVSADTLAKNSREVTHKMQSLGFMTQSEDATNAGILCFGRKPADWLGGAYIQFVRFDGTDRSAPIKSHREIRGTLLNQVSLAEGLLESNITTPAIIGAPRRVDFPDYPFEALRQLMHNAILHRNYEGTNAPVKCDWFSDHVEIGSPGGPYGEVTTDTFGQPGVTDYRNPILVEMLKNAGVIEKCGVGIMKAQNAMRENGNPELELSPKRTWVTVVLRKLDLGALTAKAAELACCQALFRFKRDWDANPDNAIIHIPGVVGLGDAPLFSGWLSSAYQPPYNTEKSAKNCAFRPVRQYTSRRIIGPPSIGDDPDPTPNPVTSLVKMARIMYILHELFEADEAEIRKDLVDSLFPMNASETKTREDDEAEFRRLMESRPPLDEMEADINREAADERVQALFIW